ncbi:MAG: ABC transporter substrate-binding protein [Deltaproteobacteria bacterium]|nr:ABC transporter substrate-binding protein [Deltaproteobacteria bacterium]
MKLKLSAVSLGVLLVMLLTYGPSQGADKSPIRIAYLQNDIHQLACWVALEKDFYAQEGLDVKVAGIFKAGPELMSAFAAGALDVGYVGMAPATTAVANKAARVVVLAQVNGEGSALVVKKDSKLQAMTDLKGKTVAVPGHATVQDFLLRKALTQINLTPQQTHIMVIKPPEMIGALRGGDIDGFIAWEPFPARAVTMEVGRVLMASQAIWKDHPCCVLAADARFLESRAEEAKKMVRAHVRATDFINQNPGEARQIGIKYTGMDEKTVSLAMKNVKYTYLLNVEAEKEYLHFLNQWKYIRVEDVQAFTAQFIHLQILSDVLKR